MVFDDALNYQNGITVIWSGSNDPKQESSVAIILSNISSMVGYLENKHDEFFVVSVCKGSRHTEGFGSKFILTLFNLIMSYITLL